MIIKWFDFDCKINSPSCHVAARGRVNVCDSFMREDCAYISSMAKPFVRPVGHHIDVAGYVLMRHTVEHIADCRGGFCHAHAGLAGNLLT